MVGCLAIGPASPSIGSLAFAGELQSRPGRLSVVGSASVEERERLPRLRNLLAWIEGGAGYSNLEHAIFSYGPASWRSAVGRTH